MKLFDFIRNMYDPPIPPQPKYHCEKHGEVRAFGIRFGAGSADFCAKCFCEFLQSNFPITEIKE